MAEAVKEGFPGTNDIGKSVDELTTPAFVVDLPKVEKNCATMLETCKKFGVQLRAQTKTHKTIEGSILQTGGTRRSIVTSTLDEAELFAKNHFDDILYGFPLIPHHLPRVFQLTKTLETFHVMVDSDVAVDTLSANSPPEGKKWSVFLKIDCGNKRAGVWWENKDAERLAVRIHGTPNTIFKGIYAHCGNSYSEPVTNARNNSIDRMLAVSERIVSSGVPCPTVGIGSTPSCRQPCPEMEKLTELHPGNYVFLDVQQSTLGSCTYDDIACSVATRVIGHYPHRNQMLIDCGFLGLSKQGWGCMRTGYGVFRGHPNLKLCAMTQEIGFVEPLEGSLDFAQFPINSLLHILPWHSCATAAMYPYYHVVNQGKVTATWKTTRGW
ncbi:D-serine dehydratase-like [Oratosquilla oratoria]|uniref:D-serine dehydratase-like n=1 Tax=Oratosquilla oratoria TaxID=337810 RepID=UPI003F76A296